MTYRCALCGHKMGQPAVRLHIKASVVRDDDKTMDLFDEVDA